MAQSLALSLSCGSVTDEAEGAASSGCRLFRNRVNKRLRTAPDPLRMGHLAPVAARKPGRNRAEIRRRKSAVVGPVVKSASLCVNPLAYGPAAGVGEDDIMPSYKAPVDDVMFLLSDVFHIDRYNNLPGFAEATPDLIDAVLGEAAKFCEDVLTPLNRVGDKEGCRRHDDGSVTTPTGFKAAHKQFTEGGWLGLSAPPEFGGQGLPTVIAQAVSEFVCSANMAFSMYSGLTQGAIAALFTHASAEQKALYLPKLVSGEWAGTMNLTEPQCGTDLGLVRTRATPQPRRQLQDHRHQDLHLRRRARSGAEHRASGAGAHRRRAGKAPRAFRCSSFRNFCRRRRMAASARAMR